MNLFRKCYLALLMICASLFLSSCGDLVEIQDRDFVLAMGISYHGQYEITFGLPELETETRPVRTYKGKSLAEIEQHYNLNSENHLDYRHLQVMILDDSICTNPAAMEELLIAINDNYNISHSVLVFYHKQPVSELMAVENLQSSLGKHLKKLSNNNKNRKETAAKVGMLIECIQNDRISYIPALSGQEDAITMSGGVFFRQNQVVKYLSQSESDFYLMALGENNEYLIRVSDEQLFQVKNIKTRLHYQFTSGKPRIQLSLTGSAIPVPRYPLEDEPNESRELNKLNELISHNIQLAMTNDMKTEHLDYLNLYEKSSYKNRDIWLSYQGKTEQFLEDLQLEVRTEFNYE